ncbi:MAG TPA: hypothetical protein VFE39_07125, partial [Pseudonocardia sp.]|nr:hypothetical protein [Pseudonocardia sp.]
PRWRSLASPASSPSPPPASATTIPTWRSVQDGTTPEGGWKLTRTDLARFITDELGRHRWSRAAPTIAH